MMTFNSSTMLRRLTLDRLPSDVLREIAYWLEPIDLSRVALVRICVSFAS